MITYREHNFKELEGSEDSKKLTLDPNSQGIPLELRRKGRAYVLAVPGTGESGKDWKSAKNSNNPDTTCYASTRRRNS